MKTLGVGLLLAIVTATGIGQERLTINGAVQTALERNQTLRGAGFERDASRWGRLNALTNFLPKVEISGGLTRIDPASERRANAAIDFIKAAAGSLGIPNEALAEIKPFAYRDTYAADITVVQPIYNGGAELVGLSAASAMEDKSISTLEDTEQDVIARVKTAYYNVLKANELVALSRDAVARTKRHVELTGRRAALGMRTRTDVLRWEVQLASDEGNLIQAENGLAGARLALNEAMGVDLHAAYVLENPTTTDSASSPLASQPGEPLLASLTTMPTESPITANMLAGHPSMRMMEASLRLADAGIDQAWVNFKPRVNVAFQYGWEKNNTLKLDGITPWALALQVQFPIFNSFGDYTNLQKAHAEYSHAQSQVETFRRGLVLQATMAELNMRAAQKRIDITRKAEQEAREVLDAVTKRYESGGASNVDVIDVQTAYTSARANAITALYDYHIASVQQARAMGTVRAN